MNYNRVIKMSLGVDALSVRPQFCKGSWKFLCLGIRAL